MSNHTTVDCRKPGRCTVCNAKNTRIIHIDKVSQGLNELASNPSLNNATNIVRFWIITTCPYFLIWEVLLAITR